MSAGTRPADSVHPEVVQVMRERKVELEGAKPQYLSKELAASAYLLITMGCGDECPLVSGVERDEWPLVVFGDEVVSVPGIAEAPGWEDAVRAWKDTER